MAIDIVLVEVRAHSCKPAFGNKFTPFFSVSIGRPAIVKGRPSPYQGPFKGSRRASQWAGKGVCVYRSFRRALAPLWAHDRGLFSRGVALLWRRAFASVE